jgi:hypothetical protein
MHDVMAGRGSAQGWAPGRFLSARAGRRQDGGTPDYDGAVTHDVQVVE